MKSLYSTEHNLWSWL